MASAKVKDASLYDVVPDRDNANRGTLRGASMIEASLRECGAGRSILLDKDNRIIAGNKTIERAADIGRVDMIVVETDGTQIVAVKRTDLDLEGDDRAKRLAIYDNRTSEVDLVWDVEFLSANEDMLAGLFSSAEIEALLEGARDREDIDLDSFNDVEDTLIGYKLCVSGLGLDQANALKEELVARGLSVSVEQARE